jgi:glycosyltransferase involved in cell wall biosynthesis
MKKVLVISYYWPPSGGGGVQRWLKMTKYLGDFGWKPTVYTPANPAFQVRDASLMKDVHPDLVVVKRRIFEPIEVFNSLFKLAGKKAPEQKDLLATRDQSLFQRWSTWLRGNLFLPDPRITWVRPSVRFLKKYIRQQGIDAVITTGPPHSMHLIGRGLKRALPQLIWLADFRDPWSEWDMWPLLNTGEQAMRRIRAMERTVLNEADVVVTISPYHVNRLKALGAKHCVLVNNGFDHVDFEGIEKPRTPQFVIRHMGSVDDLRDPRPFMRALERLIGLHPEMRSQLHVEFYGPVNTPFREFVSTSEVLQAHTSFHAAVPHSEVIPLYISSSLLLLVLAHTDIADGNAPGKMYEYMASRTMILGVGPRSGDAAAMLRDTQSGVMFERTEEEAMAQFVLDQFNAWKNGALATHAGAPQYARRSLASAICKELDAALLRR